MAAWPGSLPTNLNLDSFAGAFKSTAIETEMETGPMKYRNRSTSSPEPYTGTMRITHAQLLTFRTFFHTDTEGGTQTFTGLPHQLTQAAVTHRFTKPSEPPTYRKLGPDLYEVSLSIEVMP